MISNKTTPAIMLQHLGDGFLVDRHNFWAVAKTVWLASRKRLGIGWRSPKYFDQWAFGAVVGCSSVLIGATAILAFNRTLFQEQLCSLVLLGAIIIVAFAVAFEVLSSVSVLLLDAVYPKFVLLCDPDNAFMTLSVRGQKTDELIVGSHNFTVVRRSKGLGIPMMKSVCARLDECEKVRKRGRGQNHAVG